MDEQQPAVVLRTVVERAHAGETKPLPRGGRTVPYHLGGRTCECAWAGQPPGRNTSCDPVRSLPAAGSGVSQRIQPWTEPKSIDIERTPSRLPGTTVLAASPSGFIVHELFPAFRRTRAPDLAGCLCTQPHAAKPGSQTTTSQFCAPGVSRDPGEEVPDRDQGQPSDEGDAYQPERAGGT